MVRICPGQLSAMAEHALATVSAISAPVCGSRTTGWTPKKGLVAEPGLVGMAPGSGVIRMPPVSVCHQVSTIGQRPLPTTSSYQFQASGLIGSPTEPRMRRDERSCFSTHSRPWPISARIAVGAV